jgi:hypothetical protein
LDTESLDVLLQGVAPSTASSFDAAAVAFEEGNDHPVENLLYVLDPSAFSIQQTPGIDGLVNAAGGYLVPEDHLGFLATSIDFFMATPTGVDYLFGPVGELLLLSPPF